MGCTSKGRMHWSRGRIRSYNGLFCGYALRFYPRIMADKGPRQCSCKFEVCHDRNPKLSRFSSNEIFVFQYPMRCGVSFVAWNVDYQSDLPVLEVVHYVRFLLLAHLVQYPTLDSVLRKLLCRMLCCEYPVACSRQHSSIRENSLSRFTHRDEDRVVILWNVEVAGDQSV